MPDRASDNVALEKGHSEAAKNRSGLASTAVHTVLPDGDEGEWTEAGQDRR